jgi:predicted acyltransferase
MYNFLFLSRPLLIKNINQLNDQMSKKEGTILPNREPLKMGYLARGLMFLKTHRILKHSFVISGFAIICIVLGYIGVTHFGIAKEYAWTGSIALFSILFGTYFSRQPKVEK